MERFPSRNQHKENENQPEILGQWDRDVLEKGIKGVIEHMLKEFKGQLPDVIVLPETSARPLMYALRPVFKMLQEKRGLVAPSFVFMNTTKPDVSLSAAEEAKNISRTDIANAPTIDTSDELKDYERDIFADPETGKLPSYVSAELIDGIVRGANPEAMKRARDTMKLRAREISQTLPPGTRIAVIDEFISNGYTLKEIRRAFSASNIHGYAVFSEHSDSAGTLVNIDDGEGNPARGGKLSFSYSRQDAVGVKKQNLNAGEDLKKYVDVIRKADDPEFPERKKRLRTEMSLVGEKIAIQLAQELEPK